MLEIKREEARPACFEALRFVPSVWYGRLFTASP